ncbi:hypothetical protein [Lichenicoccus sp.]|uniref:hypothetical protein n=1 Tax=Lichenicoccus sp. TaxID=2781899 RepID=UPI003D0C71AD
MAIVGQRRLQFSERIISAADIACIQGQFVAARRLLLAAEHALGKTLFDRSRKFRDVHEGLAAAHARLWEAQHAAQAQHAPQAQHVAPALPPRPEAPQAAGVQPSDAA